MRRSADLRYLGTVGDRAEFFVAIPNVLNLPERIISGRFSTKAEGVACLRWLKRRERNAMLFEEYTAIRAVE